MITAAEKEKLGKALTSAFNEFIIAFSAFGEHEVNQPTSKGSWTPTQVAQHIILATDGVPDGNTGTSNRAADAYLPMIRPWWEDLSQKFKSPEPLQPDNKPHSKKESLSELNRVNKKNQEILSTKDLSAVCLDFELPTIGYLTRYEWLWFIEMHLKRHTFQLKNMRA